MCGNSYTLSLRNSTAIFLSIWFVIVNTAITKVMIRNSRSLHYSALIDKQPESKRSLFKLFTGRMVNLMQKDPAKEMEKKILERSAGETWMK